MNGTKDEKKQVEEKALPTKEEMRMSAYFITQALNDFEGISSNTVSGQIALCCLKHLQKDGVIKCIATENADIVGPAKEKLESSVVNSNKKIKNRTFIGFQIRADILRTGTEKLFSEGFPSNCDPIPFTDNIVYPVKEMAEDTPSLFGEMSESEPERQYIDLYIEEDDENSLLYIIGLDEIGRRGARWAEVKIASKTANISLGYLLKLLVQYNKALLSSDTIDCITAFYFYSCEPIKIGKDIQLVKNVPIVDDFDTALSMFGFLENVNLAEYKGKTEITDTKYRGNKYYKSTVSIPTALKDKVKDIPAFKEFADKYEPIYDYFMMCLAEKERPSKKEMENLETGISVDLSASKFAPLLFNTETPTPDQINEAYDRLQNGSYVLKSFVFTSGKWNPVKQEKIGLPNTTSLVGSVFTHSDPEKNVYLPPSTVRIFLDPLQAKTYFSSKKSITLYKKLLSISSKGGSLAYNVGRCLVNNFMSDKFSLCFNDTYQVNQNRIFSVETLLTHLPVFTMDEMKGIDSIRKKGNYPLYTTQRVATALEKLEKFGFEITFRNKNNPLETLENGYEILKRKYQQGKDLIIVFNIQELVEDETIQKNRDSRLKKIEERKEQKNKTKSEDELAKKVADKVLKSLNSKDSKKSKKDSLKNT